jgi:putative ABC transport system substrate-binding protein
MKEVIIMKKIITVAILALIIMACGKKDNGQIKIGISQIVEHPALDAAREGFIKALLDKGYTDGENIKINYQNAQNDISIAQSIADGFVSDKSDMILAIATPSAQAAYNATKEIPILITAVTDPVGAGLVKSNIKPETNVSGTSDATPIASQFALIKELLPNAEKIGIIYNTSEQNSIAQVNEAKRIAKELGLKIIESGVTNVNEIAQALDVILNEVDVLYTPTDNLIVSATPLVVSKTLERKIPLIGCIEDQVNTGALATETIDYFKLGYQTGQVAIKIINGESVSTIPVETLNNTELILNKTTAKMLGINLSDELLSRAKIVE